MRVLAGDIGGTHARLAIVELGAGAQIVSEQIEPSQAITALAPFIDHFLSRTGERPTRGCIAIAGPVVGDQATGTNLPWGVDAGALSTALGIPVLRLINDFEAVGYGIALLKPEDVLTLQTGEPDPGGPIALIGAGTGLGEGFLVRQGEGYSVHPSEGGHSSFVAEDARGWALHQYLAERYGHVSWERVVSGLGFIDLLKFLSQGRPSEELTALRAELAGEDAGAVITRHALAGTNRLAAETLELFIEAYGAQAGNLALTVLATGGVYLAGGIARHIAPKLTEGAFMSAFRRKGRMAALLERMPVRVIMSPNIGLRGAAVVAGKNG